MAICYYVEFSTTDSVRKSQSVDMYIEDVEQLWKWQYVIILSPQQLRVLKILESHSHNMYIEAVERLWK